MRLLGFNLDTEEWTKLWERNSVINIIVIILAIIVIARYTLQSKHLEAWTELFPKGAGTLTPCQAVVIHELIVPQAKTHQHSELHLSSVQHT
jgi:hypothetical protein